MNYKKAYIIEVIRKLRETSSTNAKIEILEEAANETPNFQDYLKAVFDPSIRYYIKKIPEYTKLKNGPGVKSWERVFKHKFLDILSDRKKTGGEAQKFLQSLLEDMSASDAEALELLILRDMKCGVNISSVNKACPGLIKTWPIMKCAKYDKKMVREFRYPAYGQMKADGLRCNIRITPTSTNVFSGNGKPLGESLDELFDFMRTKSNRTYNIVFDGELLVRDPKNPGKFLPRKESNGLINRAKKGNLKADEVDRIVFLIWDAIPVDEFVPKGEYDRPYTSRFNYVKEVAKELNSANLEAIETRTMYSPSDVNEYFSEVAEERGLEGIILKDPHGSWVDDRPKYQLKFKLERTADLEVIEVIEGTGKYKGMVGAFKLKTSDGICTTRCGSGLNDKDREELWKIREELPGKIVEIKYNEKITNSAGDNSLFLPIYVTVRDDKDVANTFEELE